jgi:N-sulfoglucosamine sulfohydrolase
MKANLTQNQACLSSVKFLLLFLGAIFAFGCSDNKTSKPNIVVFTVDDMDITSVNAYGNPLPGLTPNMDMLASQGIRFTNAHVSSAICMPCRQSMMTGLHAHSNGSMGFIEVEKGVWPSLSGMLMENGYYSASIGKGRDYKAFTWDMFVDGNNADDAVAWYNRKPSGFYEKAKTAIQNARNAHKPIYLGVNTSDPHRPFPGSEQEKWFVETKHRKVDPQAEDYPLMDPFCTADEVPLFPYLPDLPDIRKEVAQYYTAVHRADNTLGLILKLLEEEGMAENTLFIFFSDHDAAMPTAKHNCYRHSSVTPLMVRWPGKIKPGSLDSKHMVSTLDIMTTILDVLNIPEPEKQDGRSMLSILQGGKQDGRNFVFTTYNYIFPGVQVFPMRAIHTKEWSYVFNPWSDGIKKRLQENGQPTENQSGLSFAAIQKAAQTDPEMQKRLNYILLRRREELFDLKADPYSFNNLAEIAHYEEQLKKMQELMIQEMQRTNDPLLESLENNKSYPESWANVKE